MMTIIPFLSLLYFRKIAWISLSWISRPVDQAISLDYIYRSSNIVRLYMQIRQYRQIINVDQAISLDYICRSAKIVRLYMQISQYRQIIYVDQVISLDYIYRSGNIVRLYMQIRHVSSHHHPFLLQFINFLSQHACIYVNRPNHYLNEPNHHGSTVTQEAPTAESIQLSS